MPSDFDFDTPTVTRRRGESAVTHIPPTAAKAEIEDPSREPSEEQGGGVEQDKPKYNQDELNSIFDEILFSGEYSEEATIRGKLRVVFRTRTAEELKEIGRIVDGTPAVFATTLDSIRSLLQLQYSLVTYQGKDIRSLKAEEKAKFIGRIPGPVIASLLAALGKFDDKVFAACQEADSNF